MKFAWAFVAAVSTLASAASAAESGETGGGIPFNNVQPYLAVSQLIATQGIFPSLTPTVNDTVQAQQHLGMLRMFGGNFAIDNHALAQGQTLSIAQNTALFSLLGTSYGGNGQTTFSLPDLAGRTIIGSGQGQGLTQRSVGDTAGFDFPSLTLDQMPAHAHPINAAPGFSGVTGGSQAFDNMQSSLTMTYMIAAGGIFQAGNPFIGQVSAFAGNFTPTGWLPADGRLVQIENFEALFTLIGTTYGGDGQTNFAMPDLRGRTVVGAGGQYQLGQTFGEESTILTLQQMPLHDHDGGAIDLQPVGGNQPFDNRQPSLALNHYIAVQGAFPGRNGGQQLFPGEPYIGEIVASATGFEAPRGYLLADGRLLSIAQNTALFSILGTTYGGDGRTTFRLPDLRDRLAVGWGNGTSLGELGGLAAQRLFISNLPGHTHSLANNAVPEPATWAMMIMGFGLAGSALRARSNKDLRVA